MKNLRLYHAHSTLKLKPSESVEELTVNLQDAITFCVDSASALTYFALSNAIISVDKNMEMEKQIEWNISEYGKLIMFDFLIDDMEICAVFENGVLLLISTYDGTVIIYLLIMT